MILQLLQEKDKLIKKVGIKNKKYGSLTTKTAIVLLEATFYVIIEMSLQLKDIGVTMYPKKH